MIPERLEELVIKHKKEGHLPFFVNCTSGSFSAFVSHVEVPAFITKNVPHIS